PHAHTGGAGRQARANRGAVGVPAAVFVARPVAGKALGAGEAGTREGHAVVAGRLLHELVIRAHVEVRVSVDQLGAAAAVVSQQIAAPEELSPVGLRTVDAAHFEEVAALGEPPVAASGVGEVDDQAAGEPSVLVVAGSAVSVLV